jgi:RNA polymerase sigma factor (sigma-70 family)
METKQYEDLSTYITLAKKMISKFAPKFYKNLAYEMLTNEDAVSDIATSIMTADWRYDSNRTGKNTGKKKTKYSYRNQCAIWAIKTYITSKYKKNKISTISYETVSLLEKDGKTKQPIETLIEEEHDSLQKKYIRAILDSDILTEKQKQQINLYYFENQTLASIGETYGVTREAIRQNLLKGMEQIRLCLK